MVRANFVLWMACIWCFSHQALAKKFLILHTNDLHSHFTGYDFDLKNPGGYAKLKTLIDQEKAWAKERGIEVILLDGGDFAEGHSYYLADNGYYSFKILDKIGYDAVVLGNHDWLMGTEQLDDLLEKVDPQYNLLSANIEISQQYQNVQRYLKPFWEFEVYGKKLAVMGLSTDEIVFEWQLTDGKIHSPTTTGDYISRYLKESRGNDLVIALTHIGVDADRELAKGSQEIDLIVGGHSHTLLDKVVWEKNGNGKNVPIVQAGCFARHLGRLMMDISEKGDFRVLDYRVIPISQYFENQEVKDYVNEATRILEEGHGKEFQTEVVAQTEVPLVHNRYKPNAWGDVIAQSFLDEVGGDLSLHMPSLGGDDLKVGDLTRMDIFSSYPRIFEFGKDPMGWTLWKATVNGGVLKTILKKIANSGFAFHLQGVSATLTQSPFGEYNLHDIRINGEGIRTFKLYRVVFPEGVVRALTTLSGLSRLILYNIEDTEVSMHKALVNKLQGLKTLKRKVYKLSRPFSNFGVFFDDEKNFMMFPERSSVIKFK